MALTAYNNINVTANAVVNTKGAYVEIAASTPYDSSRLYMIAEFGNAGQRNFLIDIATGAIASETIVIANLQLFIGSDGVAGGFALFSLDIPAGTRLSARCQSTTGAALTVLNFYLDDRELASISNPVVYGADTANSRGTQVDPGASIGVKGSYVELTASTSLVIDRLLICLETAAAGTFLTSQRWSIDIATGAAASEVIIVPDLTVAGNNPDSMVKPEYIDFPLSIPAGTRISARALCNINTAIQRIVTISLVGMQEPEATSGGSDASSAVLHGANVIPYRSNYY